MEKQQANLLDVGYFHIVVTLPHQLSPLALQNKRLLYGLLFRCASQTLLTIAGDPKHLGAKIGVTAILHTWGQTLMHHPHVHCVAAGGGLSPDGQRWIPARPGFFLPVRVLSKMFQGKYLARYTHRVAISNRRLVSISDGQVTFRYKDYRHAQRQAVMRLPAVEFIRRFLLHGLPKGFVRIRHYGLLANRVRQKRLEQCRHLIARSHLAEPDPDAPQSQPTSATNSKGNWSCPKCGQADMHLAEVLPPVRAGPGAACLSIV